MRGINFFGLVKKEYLIREEFFENISIVVCFLSASTVVVDFFAEEAVVFGFASQCFCDCTSAVSNNHIFGVGAI